MNPESFLKNDAKAAVGTLVPATVNKLKKASSLDDPTLIVMIKSLVIVMRALGMTEGLRLLGLVIMARCAEKGVDSGDMVRELITPPIQPVAKPTATAPAPIPTPITTAPARTMTSAPAKTAESVDFLKKWRGYLREIVAGKKVGFEPVQNLTSRVFNSPPAIKLLTADDWKAFLSALKIVDGNSGHLINKDADPFAIFTMAPLDLATDLLFGQDGLVLSTTIKVKEEKSEMLPVWVAAHASTVLNAVDAVDRRQPIGEHEEVLLQKLICLLEKKNLPPWLSEICSELQTAGSVNSEIADVHKKAKVKNNAMADKLVGIKVATNGNNGHGKIEEVQAPVMEQATAPVADTASAQ